MQDKFKSIIIIYFALIVGIILAYFFGVYESVEKLTHLEKDQYILLLAPFGFFIIGELLKRKMLNDGLNNNTTSKHEIFQSANLVKWALLEGGCFISIFTDFLPQINLILFLILFGISFPSKKKYEDYVGVEMI